MNAVTAGKVTSGVEVSNVSPHGFWCSVVARSVCFVRLVPMVS